MYIDTFMVGMSRKWVSAHLFFIAYVVDYMMKMAYLCLCKQGEKVGCDRFIGTPNFGVQGGRDATLFFFYGSESARCAGPIYQPPRNYQLS